MLEACQTLLYQVLCDHKETGRYVLVTLQINGPSNIRCRIINAYSQFMSNSSNVCDVVAFAIRSPEDHYFHEIINLGAQNNQKSQLHIVGFRYL